MKPTNCARCGCDIIQPSRGKRMRCVGCSVIVAREKNRNDKERSRHKQIIKQSTTQAHP